MDYALNARTEKESKSIKPSMKKKSIKALKRETWQLCSRFIRTSEGGRCFTCGVVKPIEEMQAGHFKHGNTKATWLVEDNIHCQCPRCNTYLSGNLSIYTLKMIDKYGRKRVDELTKLSLKSHYFTREELEKWHEYYSKKLCQ